MNSRKVWIVLVLVSFALGLGACSEPVPQEVSVVRPVKIQVIRSASDGVERNLPGTIEAVQNAEMAFQVPGRIIEIMVAEGQEVTSGTELARIDARDYEASVDQATAAFTRAQAELDRSERIFQQDSGAISASTIETNREAVQVAEANLRQAQRVLEDTVLRAPFDGLVARRMVTDFETVQALQPVLTVQDLSTLEIEVAVPERSFAQSEQRLTAEQATEKFQPIVRVSSIENREFPARVSEFATTADPGTRTFSVHMQFDTPSDLNILPGMTARVFYRDISQSAITLPSHATFSDSSGNANVWLLHEGSMTVSQHPVTIGFLADDEIQILDGLRPGDEVAVSGVNQLRDGMKVNRL
ncbi:MAG: hemolysin D [Nitrospirales bacterium]|nr:MAG: hemolysin D [Nitrospirales bacterium]